MLKKPILFIIAILLILPVVAFLGTQQVFAATITVTNANDSGAGSLRQAIIDANASVGVTDTIAFSIGSGQANIVLSTQLPNITDPVIIDGTTQPGGASCGTSFANRNLLVQLRGAGDPVDIVLLLLDAGSDGSTIKGLVINKSGVTNTAVQIQDSDDHIVQCNNIGTDVAGTATGGVQGGGLQSSNSNNLTIGGTGAGQGNIISGNDPQNAGFGGGLRLTSDGSTVRGNYIGVGAQGGCIGNGDGQGISITGSNNIIGGNSAAARNVVSCHKNSINSGSGIGIIATSSTSADNIVQGNYIGTNVNGQVQSGYGNDSGILIVGATNTLVGGTGAGQGNIVAGNTLGIANFNYTDFGNVIHEALNNSFLGNSIYSNSGGAISALGIDNLQANYNFTVITNNGVTLNDGNDVDSGGTNSGPNHYLNFPEITSVTSTNGQVTITYNLDINDAEAGATGYRVEFFANDAADPSGYGEGQTILGADNVDGDVTARSVTFNLPDGVSGSKFISSTTTMTDASDDGFGHTSEFSENVEAELVAVTAEEETSTTDEPLADTGQNTYLYSLLAGSLIVGGSVFMLQRKFYTKAKK